MPQFTFVARDSFGRTQRGTQDAVTERAAAEELRSRGLLVLEVSPPTARRTGPENLLAGPLLGLWRLFPPRSIDVEISLQQLAFMLRSDLPLLAAIRTCAAQSTRYSMGRIWNLVGNRIHEGGSLSTSLQDHRCFSRLVVTMAAVGEETGILEAVLLRAANALERRRLLATNVKTTMTYPAIVILMAIGVVAYMMLGLIPKLRNFLTTVGRRLPPMTQLLIDISTFVQIYYLHGIALLVLSLAALWALHSWAPARLVMDRWILRLPLIGGVLRISATAMFARGMGTLLESGVRLTEALRVVEPLHRNRFVASRVATARDRVLQGAALADSLGERGGFLPILPSMIAVGESSGTLEMVLNEVAAFHESRLEALIRRLSAIMEPVIILVVGGIVGFIYLAFFMAIYSIAGFNR